MQFSIMQMQAYIRGLMSHPKPRVTLGGYCHTSKPLNNPDLGLHQGLTVPPQASSSQKAPYYTCQNLGLHQGLTVPPQASSSQKAPYYMCQMASHCTILH